jgi:hypothetical protein
MTDDANRTPTTFYLDAHLMAGLKAVKDRDGVSISEQIRRAIAAWLVARGIKEGKRAATRKRR